MNASNRPAQLFHAPFACSFAIKLAAKWGDVDLDILPVRLGVCETELEVLHRQANLLGQVSTLILPDNTILTETSTCLVWVQSQSLKSSFKRAPDSAEYFQMLRWIGFCSTELHKQILRIVFYDEATEDVKDNFRKLSVSRLSLLNSYLEGKTVFLGETLSAADAYVLWFLTLSDRAGVSLSPYKNIKAYFETHQGDPIFRSLCEDDSKLKESLSA